MEEVWKDINLASLQENPGSTMTSNTNCPAFPSMILQDFLAKSSSEDQTRRVTSTESSFLKGTTTFNPIEPHPATALSLKSRSNPKLQSFASPDNNSLCSVIQNLATSVSPCISKKRPEVNDENTGDWRHKRIIKNRESAARSRARKQTYTNELELKVALLMEENAKLRKQQKERVNTECFTTFLLLAAPTQLPKKRSLQRSSTAPF